MGISINNLKDYFVQSWKSKSEQYQGKNYYRQSLENYSFIKKCLGARIEETDISAGLIKGVLQRTANCALKVVQTGFTLCDAQSIRAGEYVFTNLESRCHGALAQSVALTARAAAFIAMTAGVVGGIVATAVAAKSLTAAQVAVLSWVVFNSTPLFEVKHEEGKYALHLRMKVWMVIVPSSIKLCNL